MKFDVIADGDGNVVGTMVVAPPTAEGHRAVIFPAHVEHRLHSVEVGDDFADLSADELHNRLKEHLGKASSS